MSKTARVPGEEVPHEEIKTEEEAVKEIEAPPSESLGSTARRVKYHKKGNLKNQDKPVSARSNNLELWLSKKKALD